MEKLDVINNYINGKLSPEDAKNLESLLTQDEGLRALLEQEKLMKEAVTQYRGMEMKAQMNAIKITTGVSKGIQVAASLVLLGMISGGTYMYFTTNSDPKSDMLPTPKTTLENSNKTISENNVQVQPIVAEKPTLPKTTPQEKPAKTSSGNINKEPNSTIASPSVQDIDVSAPIDFGDAGVLTKENDGATSLKSPKTDVNIEYTDSDELRYKNYNSKLYLIGKFDKKYEIIAVKANELYLNYNGSFYYLRDNVRISTKLEKVGNSELLRTLNKELKSHSH